jgi:uncharacterized membrane protein YsdA (DUF1294 family)
MATLGTRAIMMVAGAYLIGINTAAVGLFYYDKQQALSHGWRVRMRSFSAIDDMMNLLKQ